MQPSWRYYIYSSESGQSILPNILDFKGFHKTNNILHIWVALINLLDTNIFLYNSVDKVPDSLADGFLFQWFVSILPVSLRKLLNLLFGGRELLRNIKYLMHKFSVLEDY